MIDRNFQLGAACVALFMLTFFSLSSQATTVVAWGDSLTAGSGGTPWPTQLAGLADGITVLNKGQGSNTSTQVATRFFAEPTLFGETAIFWTGRNNYTSPETVKADIQSMVAALTTQNFLVLGIINGNYGGYESIGGVGYSLITSLNVDLANIYGVKFLDIRSLLVSSYDPLSSADLIDFGRDIVPSSLRADNIHLTCSAPPDVARLRVCCRSVHIEPEAVAQTC